MAKDAKNNKKEVNNKKHFFKDFKAELKKVIWPTPKQIVNNTIAVITIVIIAATIVFVLDFVFRILNDKGLNKIKEKVKKDTVIENVVDDNTDNTENNEQEKDDTEVIEQDGVKIETTPTNSVEENATGN